MSKHLSPEEQLEANRAFAAWRNAANAAHEAKESHGVDSAEYGRADTLEGEFWDRYKRLRPVSQKNWAG